MTLYDRRGAEITKGCYVIWHENRSGGYGTGLYTVDDVQSRVKIITTDPAYFRWVGPDSVIVVESLPQVVGRFNTEKGTKAWQSLKRSS